MVSRHRHAVSPVPTKIWLRRECQCTATALPTVPMRRTNCNLQQHCQLRAYGRACQLMYFTQQVHSMNKHQPAPLPLLQHLLLLASLPIVTTVIMACLMDHSTTIMNFAIVDLATIFVMTGQEQCSSLPAEPTGHGDVQKMSSA